MKTPLSEFTVLDLKNKNCFDLLDPALEEIKNSNDRLKDNYAFINTDQYISFTAVMLDNRIVSFSGLQIKDFWGKKNARALSRYYISQEYRHGLNLLTNNLFAELMLPIQIEVSKKFNFENIFISREKGFRSFSRYISYMNSKILESNFSSTIEKYNVCGNLSNDNSCNQFLTRMPLTNTADYYWTISMSKYKLSRSEL